MAARGSLFLGFDKIYSITPYAASQYCVQSEPPLISSIRRDPSSTPSAHPRPPLGPGGCRRCLGRCLGFESEFVRWRLMEVFGGYRG